MVPVDTRAKTSTDGNHPLKTPGTKSKFAKRSKILPKGGKLKPTQSPGPATKGPAMPGKPCSQISKRWSHVRVQGRLKDMLRTEISNLEKAESLLRSLWLAMEFTDRTNKGVDYFPDLVDVTADLIERSRVDLEGLSDGSIPEPLMAALRVER